MRKFLNKSLLVLIAFLVISTTALAQETQVRVFVSGTTTVNPGETATIIVETIIKEGTEVQGVQIDFDFSDNFPVDRKLEIVSNTTGWENAGITEHNLLAFGNINPNKSAIVARITFDVPQDAKGGTKYVFTPVNAVGATANEEFDATLSAELFTVTVPGGEENFEQSGSSSAGDNKEEYTEYKKPDTEQNVSQKPAGDTKWKNPFSDVNSEHWFYESVEYVCTKELMSGIGGEEFSPNTSMTRGMLVTILYRLAGSPQSKTFDYVDVPRTAWYTKSVDWAAVNGIVNGIGDKKFAPDALVTREQIAVILYNYAKFHSFDLSKRAVLTDFADHKAVSSWATDAMQWSVASGIISGKQGNVLDASGNATRAETATMIKRFAESILKH